MNKQEETRNPYAALRALVIEDQPFVRRIVVLILSQLGFRTIDQAADGREGLLLCSVRMFDVIICDISMEPVGGLQFLETLRKKDNVAIRDTPVLFLTSHTEEDIIKRSKTTGVNSYLLKPPSVQSLKSKVDFLLRTRASQYGQSGPAPNLGPFAK